MLWYQQWLVTFYSMPSKMKMIGQSHLLKCMLRMPLATESGLIMIIAAVLWRTYGQPLEQKQCREQHWQGSKVIPLANNQHLNRPNLVELKQEVGNDQFYLQSALSYWMSRQKSRHLELMQAFLIPLSWLPVRPACL